MDRVGSCCSSAPMLFHIMLLLLYFVCSVFVLFLLMHFFSRGGFIVFLCFCAEYEIGRTKWKLEYEAVDVFKHILVFVMQYTTTNNTNNNNHQQQHIQQTLGCILLLLLLFLVDRLPSMVRFCACTIFSKEHRQQ